MKIDFLRIKSRLEKIPGRLTVEGEGEGLFKHHNVFRKHFVRKQKHWPDYVKHFKNSS